jgi:hypothetical protein
MGDREREESATDPPSASPELPLNVAVGTGSMSEEMPPRQEPPASV